MERKNSQSEKTSGVARRNKPATIVIDVPGLDDRVVAEAEDHIVNDEDGRVSVYLEDSDVRGVDIQTHIGNCTILRSDAGESLVLGGEECEEAHDSSERELVTDGGRRELACGDVVQYARQEYRVVRATDEHVEIYQVGSQSTIVERSEVDVVAPEPGEVVGQ